ncbi:tyrosine-type recombinase/integrase [Phenylobacterium sp.]|uniref:tyrosine-type recombinase/integrase n=1 Tax=Phenylobacterium sp. TaxID=1871053 RepID=UPI0035AE3F83
MPNDARARLTRRLVEALQPAAKDRFVWDSEVTGFGVKVAASGLRTYVLQYRFGGRARRFSIGAHGSPWTVETARDQARVLLGRIAGGCDPQEEKQGARRDLTVAELCDLYLCEGLVTRKPSSIASARADIENHIKPLLGAKRAALVTRQDVERLLIDVAAGKTARRARTSRRRGLARVRGGQGAANAAVVTLSAAFSFGMGRQVRPDNPAQGVRRFPEKKIERFLSPAELARLGEVLAAAESLGVESPYALAAIKLLMLTGCRKNEILTLKRNHVDLHHRCLRLPDSKTGAKVVHLGAPAVALIARIPETAGNPYLLPGRNGVGHLVDLQATWERIRTAAGLEDVRIHDLRHSFASVGATTGDSLLIIGALLGHRSAKTTERYAHLSDHPIKGAADRISAEIARMLGLFERADAGSAAPPPAPPPLSARPVLGDVVQARWLDTPAAAAFLGNTVGTLQTWRWMGVGPSFRRIGRRIVYARADLQAWQREHGHAPAAAGAELGENVISLAAARQNGRGGRAAGHV